MNGLEMCVRIDQITGQMADDIVRKADITKLLRDALTALLQYAENAEVMIEAIWGDGRPLAQIEAEGCLTPAIVQAREALARGDTV
jgi:hypothetical protein